MQHKTNFRERSYCTRVDKLSTGVLHENEYFEISQTCTQLLHCVVTVEQDIVMLKYLLGVRSEDVLSEEEIWQGDYRGF
jgi:hypothetical protein